MLYENTFGFFDCSTSLSNRKNLFLCQRVSLSMLYDQNWAVVSNDATDYGVGIARYNTSPAPILSPTSFARRKDDCKLHILWLANWTLIGSSFQAWVFPPTTFFMRFSGSQ